MRSGFRDSGKSFHSASSRLVRTFGGVALNMSLKSASCSGGSHALKAVRLASLCEAPPCLAFSLSAASRATRPPFSSATAAWKRPSTRERRTAPLLSLSCAFSPAFSLSSRRMATSRAVPSMNRTRPRSSSM